MTCVTTRRSDLKVPPVMHSPADPSGRAAIRAEGRRGVAVLARRHGLAAWWVGSDGRLEMTAAARPQTARLAGEAD